MALLVLLTCAALAFLPELNAETSPTSRQVRFDAPPVTLTSAVATSQAAVELHGYAAMASCDPLLLGGSSFRARGSGGLPTSLETNLSLQGESSSRSSDGACRLDFIAMLPLRPAFECSETTLHLRVTSAHPYDDEGGNSTTESFCSQPRCEWYASRLVARGGGGLVGEPGSARLGLLCSHAVTPPTDCLRVTFAQQETGLDVIGMAYSTRWEPSDDGLRIGLHLEWDPAFRGQVTVDVAAAARRQQCHLNLAQPLVCPSVDCSEQVLEHSIPAEVDHVCDDSMKVFHSPAQIDPLTFTIVESLPVVPIATSITYGCSDSQQCGARSV